MLAYKSENIVALATPPGPGALAIIRLSGPDLTSSYQAFSLKDPIDRRAVYSKIYHPINSRLLDESIITYFKSPNSFTGEDVIEITCHGGVAVPKSIIMAAIDSGFRNANPGEFSFRAFLNGKIDLIQAEAVASLISSKSKFAADISLHHLVGNVSTVFNNIRVDAVNILSLIENELNFSEEELDHTSYNKILNMLSKIHEQITSIINDSTFGRDAMSGIRIVLLGKANSGKSSLFNAIIGFDRAIVSDIQGTTRDTIEYSFELEGIEVCLVDTAGVWESDDFLDKLSIQKTLSELKRANLCLLIDENDPTNFLNSKIPINIKDHCLLIKSKFDLSDSTIDTDKDIFYISSKNGDGIDKLLTYISTYIKNNINRSCVYEHILTTRRQRSLLKQALSSINCLIGEIRAGLETDILASGLYGFIAIIKDVMGEVPNKEVLNNIFSKYCVGK